jgi:hypothetical protein
VASITGAAFAGIWNATEASAFASIYQDPAQNATGTFRTVFQATPTGNRNSLASILIDTVNQYKLEIRDNAVAQVNIGTGTHTLSGGRLAGAWKVNDFALSANGGAVVVSSSGQAPTTDPLTQMVIGGARDGNALARLNGYIRELAIWKSRRPNTNLQSMTQ